jgi:hypothetical protein
VRAALRDILTAHQPNPAVVFDRHWNIVDANAGIPLFTEGVADFLLQPPINVLFFPSEPPRRRSCGRSSADSNVDLCRSVGGEEDAHGGVGEVLELGRREALVFRE